MGPNPAANFVRGYDFRQQYRTNSGNRGLFSPMSKGPFPAIRVADGDCVDTGNSVI